MKHFENYMGFDYATVKVNNFPIEAEDLCKIDLKIVC